MSKDKDISLAFVTLNNSEDLIRTYLSIKNLSRIIQEIIVVDSSNNNVIRDYCDSEIVKYFSLKYIWEQPKGIYHAMNSALHMAEANNYIWYLNPGDLLVNSNVLEKLLAEIKNKDLVWGYAQAQKQLGHSLEIFPRKNLVANLENIASGRLSVSHQSMLTNVNQLKNLGGFDEKYEVAADLKVQILLSKNFMSTCILLPIVEIDPSGISHNRILRTFFETFVIRFRTKGYSKFSSIFLAIKFIWSKIVNKILKNLRIIV